MNKIQLNFSKLCLLGQNDHDTGFEYYYSTMNLRLLYIMIYYTDYVTFIFAHLNHYLPVGRVHDFTEHLFYE